MFVCNNEGNVSGDRGNWTVVASEWVEAGCVLRHIYAIISLSLPLTLSFTVCAPSISRSLSLSYGGVVSQLVSQCLLMRVCKLFCLYLVRVDVFVLTVFQLIWVQMHPRRARSPSLNWLGSDWVCMDKQTQLWVRDWFSYTADAQESDSWVWWLSLLWELPESGFKRLLQCLISYRTSFEIPEINATIVNPKVCTSSIFVGYF